MCVCVCMLLLLLLLDYTHIILYNIVIIIIITTTTGMLAKNNLRNVIKTKLRIFPGEQHLHEDMLPPGTLPINHDNRPKSKLVLDEEVVKGEAS